MMLVALDYDGTYTLDPRFWDQFIRHAQDHGHVVVCVTMRYPSEPIEMPCQLEVIYTSRVAKAAFMANIGRKVDIWIDDSPHWILSSSG